MLTFKEVDTSYFPQYDQIPMRYTVYCYYRIEKHHRGLGGFTFVETPIEPFVKDFCTGEDESVERWKRWDLTNWVFFMAFDGDKPVAAATVASKTEGVNMLAGRDDLAVLWDLRVDEKYKGQGVGQKLFDMVVEWCRKNGLTQLKIECQTNNVPACNFYHKQGAVLGAIDEYAYYNDPEYRHEVMLLWYLDL